MGQVSAKLRKVEGGYSHWCPGCEESHILPHDGWIFNGDLNAPTFTPSFRHTGKRRVFIEAEWSGEWRKDNQGNLIEFVCHYILTNGILNFCGDSTHAMANDKVPLPDLPVELRD